MTIPKLTPYTGQVANPDGSQTQSEFTQNMFDQLSYEAQLATELDATIDGMNNAVDEVESFATDAQNSANAAEAAASTAGYQGLWPDTGGSALKGEIWQTQVGGAPTGEYYTALQNTSVNPVGDNVNWKIQNDLNTGNLSDYTDIVYKASGGNSAVENMVSGIPITAKVGDKVLTGLGSWERISDSNGDISDFKPLNLNVFDFYKPSDGVTYDNAIVACVDYYQSQQSNSDSATKIGFPPHKFRINSVDIDDLFDTELDFNGALVLCVATSPTTAALRINNYNNIKVSNIGGLVSFSNTNYTYGALFTGGPGGTIDPTFGLGKELAFSNSTILRFARGIKIGSELIDTNHGQNSLVGVHIKECNQGLIAAGSQTIVSVTGGSLGSGGQDIYGIPDSEKVGVLTLGATVVINTTEGLKTQGIGYGYGISNCLSDAYDNQYGTIIHNGSYIETTSIARIFKTPKPSGDPFTPSSLKSSLLLSNLSGGVSGANNISVVCNDDDYAGRLSLQDSNVYGFGGTRTAPAIDVGNSSAEIDLGRRFFRKPFFKSNLEEVVGGVMCLDNDLIARSENLNGQTITTAGDILKFQTVFQTGRFDRFKNIYVPATGALTIPKGGFTQMTLEVGLSSNTFDGVVRVLVNGVAKYNFYTSVRMDFSTTLFDLDEGDEVSVRVEPSADVTFGSLATDYIQVTATR